jgi:AhpD family alkylhydroperoxidase
MATIRTPIQGQPFNDVLNELHAHALTGVPDESDPFILSELEREYIAFALAVYYQCEHCQVYHARVIDRLREAEAAADWDWQQEFIKVILFLRTDRRDVSDHEWDGWLKAWRNFAVHIHWRYPGLACYVAYAVGIARGDRTLMDLAFGSISTANEDSEALLGLVRDIDRLVVFMKAATSKNRTDPVIRAQLLSRGIRV